MSEPLPARRLWSIGVDGATWNELAGRAVAPPAVGVTREIQLDSATAQPCPPARVAPPAVASPVGLIYLTSWQGRRYHPETIRRLAADRGALALMAARTAAFADSARAGGIVMDFGEETPKDLRAMLDVIRAVRDSVQSRHVAYTMVVIPAADTVGYPTQPLVAAAGYGLLAFTDERTIASAAGPVVTIDRTRRLLARRVSDAGPRQLIAAFPAYGYVWRADAPAEPITIADARRLATQANVDVIRDPAFYSLHAVHPGDWELWIGDAQLEDSLESEARSLGVPRIAAWGAALAGRN